jgi:hypothetical protein
MQSTLRGSVPEYIGADLTDRYSAARRDIDLCGLRARGDDLIAEFWHWKWDPPPGRLVVDEIGAEIRAARAVMIDGSQALARIGSNLRECERRSSAAGKTGDRRPSAGPYAGFICGSLGLFAALDEVGIVVSPPGLTGGVSEIYPGYLWKILSGGRPLPKKGTAEGRRDRKRILESFGVRGLCALPTHDENDACLGALVAAAADGRVPGLEACSIGGPLFRDAEGALREGPMVILRWQTPYRLERQLNPPPYGDGYTTVTTAEELLVKS